MTQTQLKNPQQITQNPEKFTDVYFTDTKRILEQEDINPEVSKKIFARIDEEQGQIQGLEQAAEVVNEITEDLDIHINDNETFETKEPLMVLQGPAQQLLEPETINLGIISHQLTEANPGYEHPDPEQYGEAVGEVVDTFNEINVPFADFGARHYHPAQQEELGEAAIQNGATSHSTAAGAKPQGMLPVGTMPHAAVLPFKHKYGSEDATLEAAKAMDKHEETTASALIDTENREATDTLAVCRYMEEEHGEDFELLIRMDTCGENYAETADPTKPDDDGYLTGKGMTVDAVEGLAEVLIDEGYRDNVDLAISSGMGDPEKARQFVEAYKQFEQETGYAMFDLVGAGSFNDSDNIHATSDIYEIEGEPIAKVGREQDLAEMERYLEQEMREVAN